MLGLVGKLAKGNTPHFMAVPGPNPYKVNLKPWDVVSDVEPSKIHPDGKKVTPAASQEDFKKILQYVPEMKQHIQELTPEQEKEVRASLLSNCDWYKKEQAKGGSTQSAAPAGPTNVKV